MPRYHLREHPDPVLREIAEPVTSFDSSLSELAEGLLRLMRKHQGAGLAAPQVGVSRRLFALRGLQHQPDRVLVNPVLIARSQTTAVQSEGCLSLPGVTVAVERPRRVSIRYRTPGGEARRNTFDGILARVLQHELDHLDGRLILDYRPRPSVGLPSLATT